MTLLTLAARHATAGFLCTGALTGALVLGSTLQGCSSNVQPSTSAGTGGTGGAHAGASTASSVTGASTSTVSSGAGATTSTVSSGTGGGTPASTSAGTGGIGGATASTSAGTGGGDGGMPVVTIAQITDPTAAGHVSGEVVKLTGLVATSSKFLDSKGKATGACSWGVFLSSPGLSVAAPHSAILALNDGTPASAPPDGGSGVFCPVIQAGQPAGDLFPDDTKPGDVFDIVGFAGSYLPSTCGAPDASPPDNTDVAQYQLSKLSSVTRTSVGGPVPAPYVLSAAEAHSLAAGQDATFLGAWGGARVEVDNVTAVLQQGMTFDPYGHMLMNDGVQVGDKLYYVGYVKATDVCYGSPVFGSATPTFNAVRGFVYVDYCTWALSPADKCHDLSPPSEDCASVDDAGGGPAQVCSH